MVQYLEKHLGITKYLLHLWPVKEGQSCYCHRTVLLNIQTVLENMKVKLIPLFAVKEIEYQ